MNDPTESRRIYLLRIYGNDHKFSEGAPDMWNKETFNMYNQMEIAHERRLAQEAQKSNVQKLQERIQILSKDVDRVWNKEGTASQNLKDEILQLKATLAEMQKRRLALAMLSSPLAPEHSSYAHISPELLEIIANHADM